MSKQNLEDESLKNVGIKRIFKYLRKKYMSEKKFFIPLFFMRILITIAALLPAIYYKKIVDLIAWFVNGSRMDITVQAISFLITIALIKFVWNILYRIGDYFIIHLYLRLSRKIYLEAFDYVHQHSYRFFSNNFTGSLIKKINKFVWAYDKITDTLIFDISNILFNAVFILIFIGFENIYFSIVFAVWLIVFILIEYYLYKRNYPYEIAANLEDSKVSWVLSDTITNNFNIKTFSSLKREYGLFDAVLLEWNKKNRKKRSRAMFIWFMTWLLMVVLEFIIFYLAIKLRNMSLISVWTFVLLQLYMLRLLDQLRNIGNIFRNLYQSFGESAEMLEILDESHEVTNRSHKQLHVESWKIEFKNITFYYADSDPIFENLSLKIKSGEKVAIVGESGSWKTTLIKLLFRFFDIQWGELTIDDQNIADVTQNSLRENVSMVPQDPILFHRTIRENICYANPTASEAEIIAAAKMARCHDFILWLNKWYETLVGERGIKLSGGERQRVAIARAILANTRILVLDEATSSLDSESEKLIQEAMDQVMRYKTVIVIAHRLSTIMKMDKIVVMDWWKIVEQWSHKELLLNEKWIYKKLRDIQSWWFIE